MESLINSESNSNSVYNLLNYDSLKFVKFKKNHSWLFSNNLDLGNEKETAKLLQLNSKPQFKT